MHVHTSLVLSEPCPRLLKLKWSVIYSFSFCWRHIGKSHLIDFAQLTALIGQKGRYFIYVENHLLTELIRWSYKKTGPDLKSRMKTQWKIVAGSLDLRTSRENRVLFVHCWCGMYSTCAIKETIDWDHYALIRWLSTHSLWAGGWGGV